MKRHSVLLKEELCEGCTNCVKNCPTRAIRVHHGKATIKGELCIDCAECIRTCVYHAKYSKTDSFADLEDYAYPIVLIPPSFYSQFRKISPLEIRNYMFKLGFREVLDVALAAEALSIKTARFLEKNPGVFISSSCPVVVRLVRLLYPELTEHLLPFKPPVDVMAEKARRDAIARGISPEEIGIFFITPCPAKYTNIFSPVGFEKSDVDKAISVDKAYQAILELRRETNPVESEPIDEQNGLPYLGMGWGQSGGELRIMPESMQERSFSVSGIHRVKALLDEISRNNIKGIKYFELAACNYGCVGGVFNVVNPFQARFNLRRLQVRGHRPVKQDYSQYNYELPGKFEALRIGQLDSDLEKAMAKFMQLEKEIELLPGLDCAACGAPDCKTLAEDIVNGLASRSDCIFLLRKQVGELADKMSALAHELPPVMKKEKKDR